MRLLIKRLWLRLTGRYNTLPIDFGYEGRSVEYRCNYCGCKLKGMDWEHMMKCSAEKDYAASQPE